MQRAPTCWQHCFPAVIDGQLWQFDPCVHHVEMPSSSAEKPSVEAPHIAISLKLMSANVLALDGPQSQRLIGRAPGPRTMRLDAQLHQQQVQVAGFQETRTQVGTSQSTHYVIYASGASEGPSRNHGCELWVHKTKAIGHDAQGNPIVLAQCQVAVLHADPRRLLVKFVAPASQFVFLVAHAPYVGGRHSLTEVQDWWEATASMLDRSQAHAKLVVFIDANAPLGACPGPGWSTAGAEPTTVAGECFEKFLVAAKLFVPATFFHLHKPPHHTWTHPRGQVSRKDYLLITEDLFPLVTSSHVQVHHDTTFSHEDHLPVMIHVAGQFQMGSPATGPKWDMEAMLDPVKAEKFRQALATLPIPCWAATVDTHATLSETQFVQVGQQHFAATPKSRHRFALASDTLERIRFKRQVLAYGRGQLLMHDPEFLTELRALEKEVKSWVHRDQAAQYAALLDEVQHAADVSDSKTLFRLLKRLGAKSAKQPPGGRPLPMLRKPDGQPVASPAERQQLWMDTFAETEAGLVTTWSALSRLHRGQTNLALFELDPDVFPTPWQLTC